MNTELLKQQLRESGMPEGKLDQVIADVTGIAISRALIAYMQTLPQEIQDQIHSLPSEEIPKYFTENHDTLPPVSQTEVDAMIEATWKDYFSEL